MNTETVNTIKKIDNIVFGHNDSGLTIETDYENHLFTVNSVDIVDPNDIEFLSAVNEFGVKISNIKHGPSGYTTMCFISNDRNILIKFLNEIGYYGMPGDDNIRDNLHSLRTQLDSFVDSMMSYGFTKNNISEYLKDYHFNFKIFDTKED